MGPNYNGILGFAKNQIQNNPNVRNNPQFAEMIRAIENNDSVAGEQLARNLLSSYGVTQGQAVMMAQKFFNLPG